MTPNEAGCATILVVDDDTDVREMIVEYLAAAGFLPMPAEGPEAMWQVLERSQIDLILLDRTMPGIDGINLLPALRERLDVGVIVVTALGAEEDRAHGLEVGADDYVAKPFNWRELTARINAVLRRTRNRRAAAPQPRPAVTPPRFERRTAAVLCADLADYVRLMRNDEGATVRAWWACRRLVIDPAVGGHGGRIVKLTGDGFLAEFADAEAAVRCALDIQEGMDQLGYKDDSVRRLKFRIGINLCPVIADNEDVYGDGVNLAARLQAIAEPGGILVAEAVVRATTGVAGLRYADGGTHQLKSIDEPVPVWMAVRGPAGGAAASGSGVAARSAT
jgi:class 3 adenylate cyclase